MLLGHLIAYFAHLLELWGEVLSHNAIYVAHHHGHHLYCHLTNPSASMILRCPPFTDEEPGSERLS